MHEGTGDANLGDGGEPLPGGACPPVPPLSDSAHAGEPSAEQVMAGQPVAVSQVLADLKQIGLLLDRVLSFGLWQHSGEQSVEMVHATAVATRMMQAAHLAAVADLDGRAGVFTDVPGAFRVRPHLQVALRRTRSQARLDVAAAHALRPDADPGTGGLPRLGVAFAQGEVSREHVDVAVRAIQGLPRDLLPALMVDEHGAPLLDEREKPMCAGDVLDERLTRFAKEHDSHALARLGTELKDVLDPDGDFDPGKCLRRGARTWRDHAGMFHLKGEFGPAEGAFLESMLDQLMSPRRFCGEAEDGDVLEVPDPRTPEQRRADALMETARAAQASGRLGTRAGEPPRITVITRAEDLAAARGGHGPECGSAFSSCPGPKGAHAHSSPGPASGGDGGYLGTGAHIDGWLVARLSCDAVLERALLAPGGAILDLGREVRTVTPAQKRALIARDRGCVVPGCTIPGAWCEAHHVLWWSEGGASDVGNYVLLCSEHHTETHSGMWLLEMRDGVPWVRPPDWIDQQRRPRRNRFHQQLQETRGLGTQLRINLDGGTTRLPRSYGSPGKGDPPGGGQPGGGQRGGDPPDVVPPGGGQPGGDPPSGGQPGGDQPDVVPLGGGQAGGDPPDVVPPGGDPPGAGVPEQDPGEPPERAA